MICAQLTGPFAFVSAALGLARATHTHTHTHTSLCNMKAARGYVPAWAPYPILHFLLKILGIREGWHKWSLCGFGMPAARGGVCVCVCVCVCVNPLSMCRMGAVTINAHFMCKTVQRTLLGYNCSV